MQRKVNFLMTQPFSSIKERLPAQLSRRWGLHLLVSIALSILVTTVYFQNQYGIYPLRRLALAGVLVIPVFLVLSYVSNTFFFPTANEMPRSRQRTIGLIALAASLLALWLLPPPTPDLRQSHQMVILASGEKQDQATNSLVEVRDLSYLNGQPVPRHLISSTADWVESDGILYTQGGPDSRIEITGEMPAGILLRLRFSAEGGKVQTLWDGARQEYDLFSRDGTVLPFAYRGVRFFSLPLVQALLVSGLWLLYGLGILSLLVFGLVILYRLTGARFEQVTYLLALVGLTLVFLYLKASYLSIDAPRVFRDSTSYVVAAQEPISSATFWAGQRSFTLPLFLKALGTNLENFQTPEKLRTIARVQTLLSAASWLLLALALIKTTTSRWFHVLLFGGVLFFSLSLEIGLWDALLLSESLSFSLFALLMAAWVWMLTVLPAIRKGWVRWAGIAITFVISLFYTFVRDSNIYFILIAGGVLVLAWLLDTRMRPFRREAWVFAGLMALLFLLQNVSMNSGNRWQIFMYDHLAVRFLKDPGATEFFVRNGMPMSDLLMKTTQMSGVEYQKTFIEAPEMQPVRDWVNQDSKMVYIRYLLSNPVKTFWEPWENAGKLINGSNLEYRSPAYGVAPAPEKLVQLNNLFFNHQTLVVLILVLAALWSVVDYLYWRKNPVWVITAGLILSLYPFMFLIWHAEPLEIERHAAQLGIQLRFGGWLALAFWGERAFGLLEKRLGKREV